MSLFKYTKIKFCKDLDGLSDASISVGILAEWYDGDFWKIVLCACSKMQPEDEAGLDDITRLLMSDLFAILYQIIDSEIKDLGWHQKKHYLSTLISRIFSEQTYLNSEFLFEEELAPETDPGEIFDELACGIPGILRTSIWHRIDPRDSTSIDKTYVLY